MRTLATLAAAAIGVALVVVGLLSGRVSTALIGAVLAVLALVRFALASR